MICKNALIIIFITNYAIEQLGRLAANANQSSVSATGANNIAIIGFEIIDVNGGAWLMAKKDKLNESQCKSFLFRWYIE